MLSPAVWKKSDDRYVSSEKCVFTAVCQFSFFLKNNRAAIKKKCLLEILKLIIKEKTLKTLMTYRLLISISQ